MIKKNQVVGNVYYTRKAKGYFSKREKSKEWISEQEILAELLKDIPNNTKVLDIPFGTGRFVDLYLEKRMDIYGLEISQDMINSAKTILGKSFQKCNIEIGDATEKLPFEDNTFDLVVCFRFLKFLSYEKAKQLLYEFKRVTKSHVIILLNVNQAKDNEYHYSNEYLQNLDYILANVSEGVLINMFEEVGFKVEKKINVDIDTNNSSKNISKKYFKTLKKLIKHLKKGTFFSAFINRFFNSKRDKSISIKQTKIHLLKIS